MEVWCYHRRANDNITLEFVLKYLILFDQGSRPLIAKAPVSYKTATGSHTSTSAATSQ